MTTPEPPTDAAGRLVQVFATSSMPEGALVRSLLESEGIPVVTKGEGESPIPAGPVYLLVPEEFEVRARSILAEASSGGLAITEGDGEGTWGGAS